MLSNGSLINLLYAASLQRSRYFMNMAIRRWKHRESRSSAEGYPIKSLPYGRRSTPQPPRKIARRLPCLEMLGVAEKEPHASMKHCPEQPKLTCPATKTTTPLALQAHYTSTNNSRKRQLRHQYGKACVQDKKQQSLGLPELPLPAHRLQ